MIKRFFLEKNHTSYAFWAIFALVIAFYFVLSQMFGRLDDINYLQVQKKELELATTQNSLEIVALQNFLSEHKSQANTSTVSATKLQELLPKYSLAPDSMTVQEENGKVTYTIEDTTDEFLLQSLILELCKMHANVSEISLKAEESLVHFVVTISVTEI